MDTVSYMLGKRAGGGTIIETDPIFSSSPASGITNNDISNWNNKSEFSGDYNDLSNKPNIPDISGKQDIMQYSTMPIASADNLDKIVQYIGISVANSYTNGYFYKCVSDGEEPATYNWENINVQTSSGGGSSYTAGTNIEITGNNVINNTIPYSRKTGTYPDQLIGSVSSSGTTLDNINDATLFGENIKITANSGADILVGNAIEANGGHTVGIGTGCKANESFSVILGNKAETSQSQCVAIGYNAVTSYKRSIALGAYAQTTKANQAMIGSNMSKINEIAMYTSNGVKVMATEEFVTNYLSTLTGYDATKTQVLKNIQGTMTWVDE